MKDYSLKTYYFDNFAECVVDEIDQFAPPERYFMIDANNIDCYTDSYRLPDGRCIDFSYSKEDSWRNSYTHWYNLLKAHLELHGVNEAPSSLRLRFRLYPREEFEEILKEYL